MRKRLAFLAAASVAGVAVAWFVLAGDVPVAEDPGVKVEPAFPGLQFERPLFFCQAPDGSDRAYVVEQGGRVWSFALEPGVGEKDLFLDLSGRVRRNHEEEGLLGFAFHPRYAENRAVFAYYSASQPRRTVLSRLVGEDETVLLEIDQPYGNHNGGMIAFGPDGMLYVGVGDGGDAGDPHGHGQDLGTLLGSILRIDVDRAEGGRPYAIPADNPFADREGARPEIWAYGLRNPWRFSFDPADGTLWVGDVGQDAWEEIDVVVRGGNYGWRAYEGFDAFDRSVGLGEDDAEFPVVAFGRRDGWSVTGGHVYRGRRIPALTGRYVYGDYVFGNVFALDWDGKKASNNEVLVDTSIGISSFGVDREGEIYLCGLYEGRIYQLVPDR